jgi:dienelactone hydrolase
MRCTKPQEEYSVIDTETVEYRDADVNLTGLFAWDASQTTRRPGVMVVHGGAGLDDHAKGRAIALAQQGYLAFACDMYGHGVAGDRQRVMARISELRSNPAILAKRANAGVEVLRSHKLADHRLAAIGYCFGGMTVLELARAGANLMAAVSVHGSLDTTQPAQPASLQAKILVCHGALDPHVPITQVNAFIEEMKTANADWQLIVYGQAMHGFTHETGPKMPGVAYHALTDARSTKAIHDFFKEIFNDTKTE